MVNEARDYARDRSGAPGPAEISRCRTAGGAFILALP